MTKEELKNQLRTQIISYLNLIDIKPQDIGNETPFFGEELELDSIDSLELIVILEREYGLKINSPTEGRKILIDINHMADYIIENGKG
jgi:acyl carrier protein